MLIVADESLSQHTPVPPCGHPQCARAAAARGAAAASFLPGYTWIPAAVHNTASCRGRCAACRQLAQPPPSYSKLFLDDQPPEYHDSLVIKDPEVCREERVATADCSRDNTTVTDVVIQMEEEPELVINVEQLKQLEDENTPLTKP